MCTYIFGDVAKMVTIKLKKRAREMSHYAKETDV